jgi:hypothetical protein
VTSARHRQLVEHATRRRLLRLGLPAAAATLVTGSIVGVAIGAAGGGTEGSDRTANISAAVKKPMKVEIDPADSPYLADRAETISRSAKRVTLEKKPEVKDTEFMTADLNLWPAPKEQGEPLDVLPEGEKVAITGVVENGFAQILHRGQVRWVNDDYLSDEKPVEEKEEAPEPETGEEPTSEADTTEVGGFSTAPCPSGSSMESGVVPGAVAVHRAVCAEFPQVTSYGGYRGDGEHADGHAIDIMVSDSGTGQAIADYLHANAGALNLSDIIWSQQIWTQQRSSEGWRGMEDRGSATANHYDHVHVRVN